MNKTIALVLALALLAMAVLPSEAAQPAETAQVALAYATIAAPPAEELTATEIVTGTPPMTGTLRIAHLIAAYFGLTADEIIALRSQDIGWGYITKALFTASETGVPLDQILAMRQQGMGWGEIRKSLGLPAGTPHSSLGTIISKGRGPDKGDWTPPGQAKKAGQGKKP